MNLVKRLARALLGAHRPHHEGRLAVRGAHGKIIIQRDGWGIPSIDAVDSWDAWFGLGFCHAQDRGGQLELIGRIVRGTLAEVAGEEGLAVDRLVRRLGIPHAGRAQLAVADPDMRAQQEAYVAGVNAGFAASPRALEHRLLGIRPTRWEAADAQSLATFLCFALAANWDLELARWQIARAHGLEALLALEPEPAEWLVASTPPLATPELSDMVARLRRDLEGLVDLVGLGGGSNAWAIAAERTASGRPLLAGDPHLSPQAPSHFYFARLECPEFLAIGATFPGIACVPSGHNGHLAWGITAAHLDNTDWFVEDVGPDGKSVRRGDAYVPCEVRREVIRVKGRRRPVVEEVLVTSHGPIVSPALDALEPHAAPRGAALALAATWLAERPYRGLLGLHLCRDVASLERCMAVAATTNVGLVYAAAPTADAPAGHIGWLVAGDVPVRRGGTGPMPQPGWDARFGWEGLVPNDRLPRERDPAAGFVAAANNVPHQAPGTHDYLGVDFLDGYRVTAISRALAARRDWDLAGCQALQLDTRSIPWEEVGAGLLAALPDGPPRALLAAWDGHMRADSPAAALFAHVVAELCRRVVAAKAPAAVETALGRGVTSFLPYNLLFARRTSHLVRLLRERPTGWFDDVPGGWDTVVAEAMRAAWDALARRFGPEPSRWAWGRVRPLHLHHPFGDKALLKPLFDLGPYAVGGDATTIPQASVDLRDPTANPIGIAVFRQVIDVGDWDQSRFALAGGQLGDPLSPRADDQMPLWLAGDGVPIHASRAERARVVRQTLTLEVAP